METSPEVIRAGELSLVMRTRNWRADQLYNNPGPKAGLWVGLPQHSPYLWSAEAREGTCPEDTKVMDLHNTGQCQNNLEESQRGASIDSLAETRGLKPANDSATNTCEQR